MEPDPEFAKIRARLCYAIETHSRIAAFFAYARAFEPELMLRHPDPGSHFMIQFVSDYGRSGTAQALRYYAEGGLWDNRALFEEYIAIFSGLPLAGLTAPGGQN